MDLKTLDISDDKFVIGERYILKERLGGGSFGQLYSALDNKTNQKVALKLERKPANGQSSLTKEQSILACLENQRGFPQFHQYGTENDLNYIAMDLLGYNLEKLFRICQMKFSLKTVLMLANQMLCRIEALHSKHFLHRDIKPENFCIGLNENSRYLYMIDFGLARSYMENGKHINFRDNKGLVGTARYASLNTHLGFEQCRRDDLESIGFTLVYFLKGKLPWQNVKAETKKEKYQLIKEAKLNISIEELCQDLPKEFCEYFHYVRSLEFTEEPNYSSLRKVFKNLFAARGYQLDYDYDWIQGLMKPTNLTKKILNMEKVEYQRAKLLKQEMENKQENKTKGESKEEGDNTKIPEEKKIIDNMNNIKSNLLRNPFTKDTKDFRVRFMSNENLNGNQQSTKKVYSMQMVGSTPLNEIQRTMNSSIYPSVLSFF